MDVNLKEQRRQELWNLLGDLPDRNRPIEVTTVDIEEREDYLLEKLVLDLNGIESVSANFVRPKTGKGPYPAIVYNHAQGGDFVLGKNELINGRSCLQDPPYAVALTSKGYAALSIDAWAFGDRRGRTQSTIFRHMLWQGQVLWGMMMFDAVRAVDYLVSRPDVDPQRVGAMGISLGSTTAWWLAALDTRIRACVDICCLTDYQALIETNGLEFHSIYYYVPGLLKHFTSAEINALTAPRPHLSLAGNYDCLTPPAGLDRIDAELKQVYAEEGASERWKLLRYDIAHYETSLMRKEIMAFWDQWL